MSKWADFELDGLKCKMTPLGWRGIWPLQIMPHLGGSYLKVKVRLRGKYQGLATHFQLRLEGPQGHEESLLRTEINSSRRQPLKFTFHALRDAGTYHVDVEFSGIDMRTYPERYINSDTVVHVVDNYKLLTVLWTLVLLVLGGAITEIAHLLFRMLTKPPA